MPSWVIQQNGGIDASAPRISGVSKRSVMNSAWERVSKLISGCSSLRRRTATGIALRIVRPDGWVGWPFMYGRTRSIAASRLLENSR